MTESYCPHKYDLDAGPEGIVCKECGARLIPYPKWLATLARHGAVQLHVWDVNTPNKYGHKDPFERCEHADCVRVRALLPVR